MRSVGVGQQHGVREMLAQHVGTDGLEIILSKTPLTTRHG